MGCCLLFVVDCVLFEVVVIVVVVVVVVVVVRSSSRSRSRSTGGFIKMNFIKQILRG